MLFFDGICTKPGVLDLIPKQYAKYEHPSSDYSQDLENKLLCKFLKKGHNAANTRLMVKKNCVSANFFLSSINLTNIKAPVVMDIEK